MTSRSEFIEAVESGERLKALLALRLKLANAIDVCTDFKELASLALRLTRVLEQIEELGGDAGEESDDLAERRRAKLSAASDA